MLEKTKNRFLPAAMAAVLLTVLAFTLCVPAHASTYSDAFDSGLAAYADDYGSTEGYGDAQIVLYEYGGSAYASVVYDSAESMIEEYANRYTSVSGMSAKRCGGTMPDGSYIALCNVDGTIMMGSSDSGDSDAVQESMEAYGYWKNGGRSGNAGTGLQLNFLLLILTAAIYVISGLSLRGIFRKAGDKGWLGFIPVAEFLILCRIAWGRMRVAWRILIPIVDIVFLLRTTHKLSKSFGYRLPFTVGLLLFGPVFYLFLAFGRAEYIGPGGKRGEAERPVSDGYGTHAGRMDAAEYEHHNRNNNDQYYN